MTAPQQPVERHRETATELGATVHAHRDSPFVQRIAAALAAAEAEGAARYETLRKSVADLADDLARALLPATGAYVADRLRALLGADGDTGSGT